MNTYFGGIGARYLNIHSLHNPMSNEQPRKINKSEILAAKRTIASVKIRRRRQWRQIEAFRRELERFDNEGRRLDNLMGAVDDAVTQFGTEPGKEEEPGRIKKSWE